MYKVFYNDRAIILSENFENITKEFLSKEVIGKQSLYEFLDNYFQAGPSVDIAILGYNLIDMYNDFISYFKFIEAAGGLVKNNDHKFLFIKRFDLWDLPKGKVEKGESTEIAAIREVTEETGIGNLDIVSELEATLHLYNLDDRICLKKTHWFLMVTNATNEPIPQLNEGITDVAWFESKEADNALIKSYRSLKESLRQYLK